MNPYFCIKYSLFDIRKISDDQYVIIDLSEYTFKKIDDLKGRSNKVNITTPGLQVFEIDVPAGGSILISLKENKIDFFQDGKYCFKVKSCGAIITKNIGYYPEMKSKIVDNLLTTRNKEKYIDLLSDFEIMKTLEENGDDQSAQQIYDDLKDVLRSVGGDHTNKFSRQL